MFVPQNEQGVIVLFASMAKEAGWEFVEIRTAYPDAVLQKDGQTWAAEFEFYASNFLDHKHDHRRCDMIVCWQNDYEECPLPIIELERPGSILNVSSKCDPKDKEIEYWKRRAFSAENRAKREDRRQLEASSDVDVSGAQRATQLRSEGFTHIQIANELGVHRNTIGAWLKHTNGHSAA